MARGDSIIRVSIIGDAKRLVGALGEADKATGGLLGSTARSVGGALLALGAVREGFQFLGDATREADRLADATTRLNIQLGDLAPGVEAGAGAFRNLGLSSQDVLELAANFADLGTAAGITDAAIAANADSVAAMGAAISLLGDQDPATVVDLIGKSAGGSARAAKELGVTLLSGVDATTQLANIMDQLKPKLDAAMTGSGDLEQSQRKLQASVEELQGKLGGPLSDALQQVVGFINDEIDAIPGAIEGWKMLGRVIEDWGRAVLGPIGNVRDALGGLGDMLNNLNRGIGRLGDALGGNSDLGTAAALRRERQRNTGNLGNP